MPEYDFYVCGDKAVLDLNYDHLAREAKLHIHNDEDSPASRVFLNLPQALTTSSLTNLQSTIDLQGALADLVILINSNTHIYNGDLRSFQRVLLTDHRVIEKNEQEVILDINNTNKANIIIENFTAKEGFVLCNQLELLKGGKLEQILGLKLEGNNTKVKLVGADNQHYLTIGKLEIFSTIESLELDKILINKFFDHSLIATNLLIKNSITADDFKLRAKQVKEISLSTQGIDNELSTESALITNLLFPKGKFYISAKSFINFKIEHNRKLQGIDLVLDMSEGKGSTKKIIFPATKFYFEHMTLLNANDVSIPMGGSCRELLIKGCSKVSINNLIAKEVKYELLRGKGDLRCSNSQIIENLLIVGDVGAIFDQIEAQNIEGSGLCSFKFSSKIKCETLKLNLNLNASNPGNNIASNRGDSLNIRIENNGVEQTEIGTILAKLSNLYIKGNIKLGAVLIQPIDKISTLLWVDVGGGTKLKLDRMFIGFDHDIEVARDGTISVIRTKNLLTGSELYASVSSAISQNSVYIKSGKGLRFDGKLHVIDGDIGLFAKYGDLFVQGMMQASNSIVLAAGYGAVSTQRATLEAKLVTIYSHTGTYLAESIIKAQELVSYSLSHYIQGQHSRLEACKIAIVAEGNININSSEIQSNQLILQSSGDIGIQNNQIISYDIFVKAIHEFLLTGSNIHLVQHPHVLFASKAESITDVIQGGLRVANDVTLIGIFSNNQNKIFSDYSWQKIDVNSNIAMSPRKAYIEANKGFIVGSSLDGADSVIIKTTHSLEIVPLTLYNEAIHAGGLNIDAIREVASRINAGLIDIDAGKAASFVGALLKASVGSIRAEVVNLLASQEDIRTNQGRIKVLKDWNIDKPYETEQVNVGRYFNFSTSTSIAQRIGNLSFYDNYASRELSFTQIDGDIILDKSWHSKYEKLYLNAERGKILIISKNLQQIYRGAGGQEAGRQAAYDSRTIIGGDNIYLSADEVIIKGSKIEVKGDLQIVTKNGVYILPVAVHERLMYHHGSKTRIEEQVVRQVISEINAGFINIKAGGVLEAVSALIQATGVNIEAKELNLRAEYDIFEKHVYFTGKKKWYGGRNSWEDHTSDKLVMPTIINAGSIYAKISGDTTIEAAQILAREESILQARGNISLLPKYDIHLHDHISKKSYLFKCHGGKLTVNSSKTVKEHFYGESPAPTVYYSGGSFFAYSTDLICLTEA